MQTKRGFVLKIEINRGGLVTVTILHADGTQGFYVIEDLDGDPERFNERLSKLAILRDAMDRAEPVEIDHESGEGGQVLRRVARLTRDGLGPYGEVAYIVGYVIGVSLGSLNAAVGQGETHDFASIQVLSTAGLVGLYMDMQIPERLVADHMLQMVRDAMETGKVVRFLVDMPSGGSTPGMVAGPTATNASEQSLRVLAVVILQSDEIPGLDGAEEVDGFVEALSLINPGVSGMLAGFANVRFTTVPPFTGPGGTVGLSEFNPQLMTLMVAKNSTNYALFEAGLRDNLRMRVNALLEETKEPPRDTIGATGSDSEVRRRIYMRESPDYTAVRPTQTQQIGIALQVELLAPLASAARPVWINIERGTLDHGPEKVVCVPGTPSSDLTPMTLRDLRLPYPAAWEGLGCFNPGVYRFQFKMPTDFRVLVDGEELCLYTGKDPAVKFAHACLGGDHLVRVEFEAWMCDYEFVMDVFRLR